MKLEYITIFIISFISIYAIIKYAFILGLIDKPNSRSIHNTDIPRGGGIGFILTILLLLFIFHPDMIADYIWTYIAIIIVFIIGIIDDYIEIEPYVKFIVIFIATLFLYFDGLIIDDVGVYIGYSVSLGWFAFAFTLFAVSGFTNALNLIDGIDGLSTMMSIIILGAFYYLGIIYDDIFIETISIITIISLLSFIIYNWHPATIFMGDSGSLTLGFIISILAIKSIEYIPAVHILFLSAIPVLDTMIVMIRRKIRGGSSFCADQCHIHHILLEYFDNSSIKTVLFLSFMQLIYIFIGLNLDQSIDGLWLLLIFILHGIGIYHLLGYIISKQDKLC